MRLAQRPGELRDLPGHGRTGHWAGKVAFRDNAGSIAALVRAAGIDRSDLAVVGHSWGAMTAAWLLPLSLDPVRIGVAVHPTRLTHEFISKSEWFASRTAASALAFEAG